MVVAGVAVGVVALVITTAVSLIGGSEVYPARAQQVAVWDGRTPEIGSLTRVTAGDTPVVDSRGAVWSPSDGLQGGETVHGSDAIGGTASPTLYRTVRDGASSYSQNVPAPGTYVIDLYLAETQAKGRGERVFDVTVNGVVVASGVDVVARVGADHADHVLVAVPVHDGRIDVDLTARVGRPMVSAIEVGYLSPRLDRDLVWSDEFDGPAHGGVDPQKWQFETGGGGWGSGNLQTYTDRPENAGLDGAGHLVIQARAEPGTEWRPAFTSARLNTQGRFSFTYGRIVVRAELPRGQGLWPGVWGMGADLDEVGFPASGELDILESTGEPGVVSAHLHGPSAGGRTSSLGTGIDGAPSDGFVDYSALWTPIGISFQVAGRDYFTGVPADLDPSSPWVFDKPFFLLVNLAVGGSFVGPPDASTSFPAQLLVDHVRVYAS